VIEIQSILLLPGHDFLLGTHIKGLFLGESGECLVVCTLPKLEHAPYLGCNTLSGMTRENRGGLSPKVQGDGRLASLFLDPTQDAISRASSNLHIRSESSPCQETPTRARKRASLPTSSGGGRVWISVPHFAFAPITLPVHLTQLRHFALASQQS
jgi:hypothetical protein